MGNKNLIRLVAPFNFHSGRIKWFSQILVVTEKIQLLKLSKPKTLRIVHLNLGREITSSQFLSSFCICVWGGGAGDAKQVGWKVDTGLEILTALDSDWSVLQDMCFLIGREADFGSCRLTAKMYYQNPDDGTHRMCSLSSDGWHLLEYLSNHY